MKGMKVLQLDHGWTCVEQCQERIIVFGLSLQSCVGTIYLSRKNRSCKTIIFEYVKYMKDIIHDAVIKRSEEGKEARETSRLMERLL